MKSLVLVLLFILSFLFLNGVNNMGATQENMVIQDTIKVKKMSNEERKQMELKEWQMRSKRIDANMVKQQQQIMKMDSILGRPDTLKIKK